MTKEQRQTEVTIFVDGVDVEKYKPTIHHILQDHQQPVYISAEKINNSFKKKNNFNCYTQLFAGGGAPTILSIDDSYMSQQVASSSVTPNHKVCPIADMEEFMPLITGCFDHKFHVIKVVDKFVEAIESAIGRNGLFPVQNCPRHVGSVSYIGEQSKQNQALPSPSKGPGAHCWFYYRNYINHVF